jgi:hypothetical protein
LTGGHSMLLIPDSRALLEALLALYDQAQSSRSPVPGAVMGAIRAGHDHDELLATSPARGPL